MGFVAAPMRWAILGYAGALQYFDLQLMGSRRETILSPNVSFPGHHMIRVIRVAEMARHVMRGEEVDRSGRIGLVN